MPLSWNEIKDRTLVFLREWTKVDAARWLVELAA